MVLQLVQQCLFTAGNDQHNFQPVHLNKLFSKLTVTHTFSHYLVREMSQSAPNAFNDSSTIMYPLRTLT